MDICFTVPGAPVGKARPRVTKYGTYNTDKTVAYEELVRIRYKEAARLKGFRGFDPGTPVTVIITAVFPIPPSYPAKRKISILAGQEAPTKKPDADNICKIILDGLNGYAWQDDSCICKLQITKKYAPTELSKGYVLVELSGGD